MRRAGVTRAIAVGLLILSLSAGSAIAQSSGAAPGLTSFASDAQLRQFIRKYGEQFAPVPPPPAVMQPAPSPPPPAVMPTVSAPTANTQAMVQDVIVVGARATVSSDQVVADDIGSFPDKSITNNQVANVDEGGIVKVHGDNLVILRRGRLFTVSTAGGALRPVDAINAYPKGIDGDEAWYDEMLVSKDRVIVIGYSYAGGGTEINRFRISASGKLTYEDTHHLRSDDYYSSRNYASRLIGDTLIFYTPLYLEWERDPLDALPAIRRWRGSDKAAFTRIVSARQVFVTPALRKHGEDIDTLHTVTQCDVASAVMTCNATVVLGPESRSFYVSGEAVYLWVSDYASKPGVAPQASLYRIPLTGARPQAVQVRGTPLDQFSFHEDPQGGFINVAVLSEGRGDAMWRPEFAEGVLALLRLPLTSFGDGSKEASRWDYRILPQVPVVDHNRFVGDYLIYGGGVYENRKEPSGAMGLANLKTQETETFRLPQPVSRIEALGRDALVVGSDDDLVLTTVALGDRPRLADTLTLSGAAEGESRSHGFFFRSDSPDGSEGALGLAMMRAETAAPSWQPEGLNWRDRAVDMLFLRRKAGKLSQLGELKADADKRADDGCVASCVDWYGNARPIFLRGRVFALLGYELVEGREDGDSIREVARTNFAPPPPRK